MIHDMISWSSHYTFEEHLRSQQTPFITLRVSEGLHLDRVFDSDELQPYLQVRQAESVFNSQVASKVSSGTYVWNDSIKIEIVDSGPLYVFMYDTDEYGDDACMAAIQITSFEDFRDSTELWLKLNAPRESVTNVENPELLATPFNRTLVGDEKDNCPLLHVTVHFMDSEALNKLTVQFGSHKTVVAGKKSYTIYHVRVKRMDGKIWSVAVRYSDVYNLRSELINILPNLKSIPFPQKTYFNFLSCVCSGCSRFDEQLIARRKTGMETFLNEVLENLPQIQSENLTSMLKLQ